MRFGLLLNKELKELWRSYRLVALAAVLVAMGILSPLAARFLPDLLGSLTPEGMVIQLPAPTVADANVQFVKNISQTGIIVLILVSMGVVARERERGTAVLVLSKPVRRGEFLTAKLTALALGLAASLLLSALVSYVYTLLLLGDVSIAAYLAMAGLTFLYLLVVLALTFLASAAFRSQLAAGGIGFFGMILLSLLGSLPRVGRLLPGELLGWALRAGSGTGPSSWGALAVSLGIIAVCLLGAWATFRRVEL